LAVLEFHLTRSTLQHPRRARAQVLGMAAQRVLAGAAALLAIAPAAGLGTRLAQPLGPNGRAAPPDDELRKRDLTSDEDLVAAGKDADEDDDFDTWYFEHAGNVESNFSAGFDDIIGPPVKKGPDEEEHSRVQEAFEYCHLGYLSPGSQPLENGVITYLVTRKSDLKMLQDSLPRLRYFVLNHWAYDVKVFIPSDALREYDHSSFGKSPSREQVLDVAHDALGDSKYKFEIETFDVRFPKVIADDKAWTGKMNGCAKAVSTSYKHMNQFFTKVMYEHPALKKYRYYMRIDADFNFKAAADGKSIQADPFCLMAKSKRKFLWQTRREVKDFRCTEGLWQWFHEYQQAQGLTPQDPSLFNELGARVNYVGYVGMGDLDFFRSEPVRKLAEALNQDGRVYLNRWSDQTYYVLLFALFEDHKAVGDMGFNWGAPDGGKWCHKCYTGGDQHFDPLTGKVVSGRWPTRW